MKVRFTDMRLDMKSAAITTGLVLVLARPDWGYVSEKGG